MSLRLRSELLSLALLSQQTVDNVAWEPVFRTSTCARVCHVILSFSLFVHDPSPRVERSRLLFLLVLAAGFVCRSRLPVSCSSLPTSAPHLPRHALNDPQLATVSDPPGCWVRRGLLLWMRTTSRTLQGSLHSSIILCACR